MRSSAIPAVSNINTNINKEKMINAPSSSLANSLTNRLAERVVRAAFHTSYKVTACFISIPSEPQKKGHWLDDALVAKEVLIRAGCSNLGERGSILAEVCQTVLVFASIGPFGGGLDTNFTKIIN